MISNEDITLICRDMFSAFYGDWQQGSPNDDFAPHPAHHAVVGVSQRRRQERRYQHYQHAYNNRVDNDYWKQNKNLVYVEQNFYHYRLYFITHGEI